VKAATTKKLTRTAAATVAIVAEKGARPEASVRVIKRGACSTLNQKGEIAYEIGADNRGETLLHVQGNSGGGTFSDNWVRFKEIQAALDKAPKDSAVTSFLLNPLFRGVSQNTVGFIWAILVKEGIVAPSATTKRRYDRAEPTAFLAQVRDLMEGKTASATGEKKSKKPVAEKAGGSKPKKSNKATKT
jgi:hypothetical protein